MPFLYLIKTFNMEYMGLPIYKAEIHSEEDGMFCISLVEDPATESNFLAFNKDEELMKFSVENEEKHLVRGLVMAANMLIYRRTAQGFEYWIEYDADTIRIMAEKYLFNGFQNNVDTQHNGNLVEGVNMVQFFIKDVENGINPKGFEDYDDGSLFAEFKVNNDAIWGEIKEGTFKGFSLAGIFEPVETFSSQEDDEYNEVMALIEKLNKKLNK